MPNQSYDKFSHSPSLSKTFILLFQRLSINYLITHQVRSNPVEKIFQQSFTFRQISVSQNFFHLSEKFTPTGKPKNWLKIKLLNPFTIDSIFTDVEIRLNVSCLSLALSQISLLILDASIKFQLSHFEQKCDFFRSNASKSLCSTSISWDINYLI